MIRGFICVLFILLGLQTLLAHQLNDKAIKNSQGTILVEIKIEGFASPTNLAVQIGLKNHYRPAIGGVGPLGCSHCEKQSIANYSYIVYAHKSSGDRYTLNLEINILSEEGKRTTVKREFLLHRKDTFETVIDDRVQIKAALKRQANKTI